MAGLLAYYHEDPLTAALGPLAVDGLMVMATASLLVTGHRRHGPATSADETSPADTPAAQPGPPVRPAPVALPTHLLPAARFALANHEQTHGRPITSGELAARMSITPDVASALLANITGGTDHAAPVNGSAITVGAGR